MCNPSQHTRDMYEITIRNVLVDGGGSRFSIGRPKLGRYRCSVRDDRQVPILPWTVVSPDDGRELPEETGRLNYMGLHICIRDVKRDAEIYRENQRLQVKYGGNETG